MRLTSPAAVNASSLTRAIPVEPPAFRDKRSTRPPAVMNYPPCHPQMERAGIAGGNSTDGR